MLAFFEKKNKEKKKKIIRRRLRRDYSLFLSPRREERRVVFCELGVTLSRED
jgi:hypothetical protein